MFSNEGRALDEDTIEYAWLLEMQLGKLSGRLTSPQLHSLIVSLETLVLLMGDAENEISCPKSISSTIRKQTTTKTKSTSQNISQNVQQTIQQLLQAKSNSSNSTSKAVQQNTSGGSSAQNKSDLNEKINKSARKTDSDKARERDEAQLQDVHKLKYKFCRLAIDAIDFWLVECGTALQLWMSPVRLATCNLHGKQVGNGLSCIIYSLSLRQLIFHPYKYNHSK